MAMPRPFDAPARHLARRAHHDMASLIGAREQLHRARLAETVHQLSYFRDAKPTSAVSLDRALSGVQESVRLAAQEASRRLTELGIRHALIGGLAVGAHGAPRNTK